MEAANPDKKLKAFLKSGEHPLGDAGQAIAFVLFVGVFVLDSFVFRLTTFPARYIALWARLAAGLLVFATGIRLIRGWHRAVSSSDAVESPHVITSGPFSRVRHPLYLGIMLVYLGVFLTTLSLASFAVLLIIFIFYNAIAGYEENRLVAKYGQVYRDYQKDVPKWIPRLRAVDRDQP